MEGYVKLYRKILENPLLWNDSECLSVWMYMLLNATHADMAVIFNGNQIILKPGQLITGRKKIAKKTNINESKVQRILKKFEIEQQIKQQTGNKNRLITIVNWSVYQSNGQQLEQQPNNNRTTSEQQLNTNKNDKKEDSIRDTICQTDVRRIIDAWNETGVPEVKRISSDSNRCGLELHRDDNRHRQGKGKVTATGHKKPPRSGAALTIDSVRKSRYAGHRRCLP